jgi:DNA-binding PadR family transcriptional regulator
MEADGWVSFYEEQEGNRPQRRVYEVTDKGKAAFMQLLRENLSTPQPPEFPAAAGLDFLYMLPEGEVIELLEERLHAVNKKFQQLEEVPADIRGSHLTVEYLHHFYASEIQWLSETIQRFSS